VHAPALTPASAVTFGRELIRVREKDDDVNHHPRRPRALNNYAGRAREREGGGGG